MATQTTEQQEKVPPFLPLPRPVKWVREVFAVALWALVMTHLLVVDLKILMTAQVPLVDVVLRYRLLVVLGCIAILWLTLGNRRFILFVGFIIAYPIVVVLWKFPKLVFRNWAVAIAFLPAIHSIFTNFRTSFTFFTIALIAIFLVCLADQNGLIVLGMLLTGAYLLIHYFRRFRLAFLPSTIFTHVSSTVQETWEKIRESPWAGPQKGDRRSEEFQQKLGQNLLIMYMTTAGLYFLTARLKEVIDSRKLDLYLVGSLVYTFALTIVVFGVEYYGLERLHPGSFTGVSSPGLVDFIGLSFSTIMTASISPLKAISGLAQLASYLQLLGSLLIIILLVFIVLTSIRERYRRDLDGVVEELGSAAERAAALIEGNYELTIASAEELLLKQNKSFARWLLRLRYGEEGAKEIPGYSASPPNE